MLIRKLPRWTVAVLLSIPAFGAGLAVSAAASGTSTTTFYACLYKGGLSKVSTSAHTCPTGYKAVSWNAVGPKGIQGNPGPTGAAGSSVACILQTLCTWGSNFSGGSYGFNAPYGVAFDGTHLWVTNFNGGSVTELNASGGSWVRTVSGGSYGFSNPYAIAFDGTHLWVANNGNSVTELWSH
jgi:DNA-binding beta-propeller fold protein YncE